VKHYSLKFMNSLILFGISNNVVTSGRSLLLYQFTRMVITLTVWDITVINFIPNSIQYSSFKVKSIYRLNYWGSLVAFNIINQLLVRLCAFFRHWREKWELSLAVHQHLYTLRKPVIQLRWSLGYPWNMLNWLKYFISCSFTFLWFHVYSEI
jgi:hypothetical protein